MGWSVHSLSALPAAAFLCLVATLSSGCFYSSAEARTSHHNRASSHANASRQHRGSSRQSNSSATKTHHHARTEQGDDREHAKSSHNHHAAQAPHPKVSKTKYAYPLDFFMMSAPEFDRTPLDEEKSRKIKNAFNCGIAENITPAQMVRSGVFKHYPLSGGIFRRREPVKYIVLHSTETGIPVPAKNVINGWNSGGRRHPGAQFVVDRDGTIYQAVDPELATVHVNIFKTLPGINNDNTIGIEMNHTGRQDYPQELRNAVIKLVCYLQDRFNVSSDNVITHKYAQQGDHTDPVNMDVEAFLATKEAFRQKSLAMKRVATPVISDEQTEDDCPVASVYVQIHGPIKLEQEPAKSSSSNMQNDASSAANSTRPGNRTGTVPYTGETFTSPSSLQTAKPTPSTLTAPEKSQGTTPTKVRSSLEPSLIEAP